MNETLANSTPARGGVSVLALTLSDAARLLSAAGGRAITVEMLQADIDAGASTNLDGTINLVHYAARLSRSLTSDVKDREAAARGD